MNLKYLFLWTAGAVVALVSYFTIGFFISDEKTAVVSADELIQTTNLERSRHISPKTTPPTKTNYVMKKGFDGPVESRLDDGFEVSSKTKVESFSVSDTGLSNAHQYRPKRVPMATNQLTNLVIPDGGALQIWGGLCDLVVIHNGESKILKQGTKLEFRSTVSGQDSLEVKSLGYEKGIQKVADKGAGAGFFSARSRDRQSNKCAFNYRSIG
jgi:hypothetical protein